MSDPMTNPPHAPAGLKYNRGYSARFWVRPDMASFKNLFAVHFALVDGVVHVNAFRVRGYLGSFAFDWGMPDHASKLLIATRTGPHSRAMFGQLLADGLGEWLLCNKPDAKAAATCSDAAYVRHRVACEANAYGHAGIYFISNGRGAIKIGLSSKCMQGRHISLQIANPDTLRVVAIVADPDPASLEAEIHASLAGRRIRGEWFAITDAEAVEIAKKNGGLPVDFS